MPEKWRTSSRTTFASAKVERARYTLTAKFGALGSGAGRASSETVKMVNARPAARARVVESGERPDADVLATLPDARDASTAASRDGFAAAPLGKPRPSRADERQFLANLARPAPELSVVVKGASKPPPPPGAARPPLPAGAARNAIAMPPPAPGPTTPPLGGEDAGLDARPGDGEDDWSDDDETERKALRAAEARATAAARAAARTRARSAEGNERGARGNGNGCATSADEEAATRARARRGYGKVKSKVNTALRARTKHAWDDDELPAAFRALPTPPTPPYLRARPATVDGRVRVPANAEGDERAATATSASSRWERFFSVGDPEFGSWETEERDAEPASRAVGWRGGPKPTPVPEFEPRRKKIAGKTSEGADDVEDDDDAETGENGGRENVDGDGGNARDVSA